ncbi:alpha/beta hydrolase fold domain-containing protein [Fulvimarina sp. MAC3]|uniref:alpha/beta hydrolase fold domain-containing protein n=1 Tax=Fulvimarina sp. MAC3 TaxID=3148887 RepID=UPI0031FC17C6
MVYIHGGGFIARELSVAVGIASDIAATLGVRVITFHYRLAPETRFPGALVDTLAVVEAAMALTRKGGRQLREVVPVNAILDVHRWARCRVLDASPGWSWWRCSTPRRCWRSR